MKILFLNGSYPFCYYYRGYLPAVYTNNLCVQEFIRTYKMPEVSEIMKMAKEADVIVFQRPQEAYQFDLAVGLKKLGKKIIFENDDTYSGIPLEKLNNEKEVALAQKINTNLQNFLRIADGAIASTEILGDEYRKINPNTVVLKNCIDPLDRFTCKKNTTGKFRVGFIGSVTSNDDYIHIKDQIRQLDERGDITIVVMGVKQRDGKYLPTMKEDADFWGSLKNVEWHTYVPVTQYMQKLSSLALDLAIIPRKNHYFNWCKSNLKFLEMSLLKIPVLAQGFEFSPYMADRDYLTLVEDDTTWYNKIIEIKDNQEKYVSLAQKAHDYVLENYNIKLYAQEWVRQIEKLCK